MNKGIFFTVLALWTGGSMTAFALENGEVSALLKWGIPLDSSSEVQPSLPFEEVKTGWLRKLLHRPKSRFAMVKSFFKKGVAPQIDQALGWRSGRCYWQADRDVPQNMLMVTWFDEWDNGPLFPKRRVLKNAFLHKAGEPEDYYDHLPDAGIEAEVRPYLRSFDIEAEIRWGSLVPKEPRSIYHWNRLGFQKWKVRQYRDFLILRLVEYNNVQAYCYFFKKDA